MLDIIIEAKKRFEENRNEQRAQAMSNYMKNHFPFYGIMSPVRKEITKSIKQHFTIQKKDFSLFAKQCFECNEREMQYLFFDVMDKYKKLFDEETIKIAEYTITHKSWWDTVDATQGLLLRNTFIKNKSLLNSYTNEWKNDKNFWLNRVSITAQLGFREKTDTAILTRSIEANLHQTEFFVTKAIGWALREYSKTNPTWVWEFLNTHTLKPLSVREASKYLV